MSKVKLMLGDCLIQLKKIPDNYVDSIVTDPPAGIAFMGKGWDHDKGGRDNWIAWMKEIMLECNRVLKPGGHMFVWSLPRTSHWTATAIEDANFEIRDIVHHVFGSGFPKSHNIGKAIDKIEGNEREVTEIRIPGRPGLSSGTKLTMKGKGSWQDGSTEPVEITKGTSKYEGWGSALKPAAEDWVLASKGDTDLEVDSKFIYQAKPSGKEKNEGLEEFEEKIGGSMVANNKEKMELGGASLKGNKKQIRETKNHHPTIKSTKLMSYLIKMITPLNGIVLDPFMGSGSTGVAAVENGFNFIGIEMEPEYFEIAKARINYKNGK